MSSIRQRIIGFLFVSLLLINTISGYYIYQHTRHEVEEIFNAEQAQIARIIDSLFTVIGFSRALTTTKSKVPLGLEVQNTKGQGHEYEQKIAYQVWDIQDRLILASENAPTVPMSLKKPGFSQQEYNGSVWHIFALYSVSSKMWIYTAQNHEARDELITLITQDQLMTMLLVNILVLLCIVIGVVKGLGPLSVLSRELSTRDGGNLKAIDIALSRELSPIQSSINRLLERVQTTLLQEKSFNADLSHELRTPLSAIKVHAQNIELKENLSGDGQQALQRIIAAVNGMTLTIEQLLLLGTIEFQKNMQMSQTVNLLDLTKDILVLLPHGLHQKNTIELNAEPIVVIGNPVLLTAMLRNLIENASKYSENDTLIQINISKVASSALVEVIDAGPGMTDSQKDNAVKRHFRVSDTQTYGSGLGLSIVKKIVDLHAGHLVFKDKVGEPGLIAQVTLPLFND